MAKEYADNINVIRILPEVRNGYRTLLQLENTQVANEVHTVVVMMNPSAADETVSDDTINKVAEALIEDSQKISILNLFPFYEPDSTLLGDVINNSEETILEENKASFAEAIEHSHKIILAWGDVPKGLAAKLHNKHVHELIEVIEECNKSNFLYVFNYGEKSKLKFISKKKRPLHPSRKKIHSLKKVKSYYFSRELLHLEFDK